MVNVRCLGGKVLCFEVRINGELKTRAGVKTGVLTQMLTLAVIDWALARTTARWTRSVAGLWRDQRASMKFIIVLMSLSLFGCRSPDPVVQRAAGFPPVTQAWIGCVDLIQGCRSPHGFWLGWALGSSTRPDAECAREVRTCSTNKEWNEAGGNCCPTACTDAASRSQDADSLFVSATTNIHPCFRSVLPPEQSSAVIIPAAARAFYARWGATAVDDGALLKAMVDTAFAQQVVNKRIFCARQVGACPDLMTCLPAERAVVEQVRLKDGATTDKRHLLADVKLHGATSGAVVTVEWEVSVGEDGVRVRGVRCPSVPNR